MGSDTTPAGVSPVGHPADMCRILFSISCMTFDSFDILRALPLKPGER